MNQKLSDWASIAEIVSGIAVVFTLVFLVVGIRENTEVTRAATYGSSIRSLNEWRLGVAQDEDLLRVWDAYWQDDIVDFSPEDRRRISMILGSQWGIYEQAYYSSQYGVLGSSEWSRYEVQICRNYLDRKTSWHELVEIQMTVEFVNHVFALCSD